MLRRQILEYLQSSYNRQKGLQAACQHHETLSVESCRAGRCGSTRARRFRSVRAKVDSQLNHHVALPAPRNPQPELCLRRQMLEYTRAAVTRNQSEKKINSLLDHVAASTDMRLLQARG